MSYDEHLISQAGGDGDMLDQIQRRADEATDGPWKVWGMSVMADPVGNSDLVDSRMIARTHDPHRGLRTFNADFIAHARTDIPALLALVREQAAKLEAVRALCADWDAVVDVFPLTPAALFAGSHAKRVREALESKP